MSANSAANTHHSLVNVRYRHFMSSSEIFFRDPILPTCSASRARKVRRPPGQREHRTAVRFLDHLKADAAVEVTK